MNRPGLPVVVPPARSKARQFQKQLVNKVRQRYRRLFFNQAVVVAGLGRCGTTLICKSLEYYGYRAAPSFLDTFGDVDAYQNGYVYKTHDLPPASLPDNVKLVFMFGNPMNIVLSAHNRMNAWGRLHHRHMGSDLFEDYELLFERDTLQLHKHFDAWYRKHPYPCITVRYETLYAPETRAALNDFLGIQLNLLPFRPRISDWTTHPKKEDLMAIYADLYQRIDGVDDVKIW